MTGSSGPTTHGTEPLTRPERPVTRDPGPEARSAEPVWREPGREAGGAKLALSSERTLPYEAAPPRELRRTDAKKKVLAYLLLAFALRAA
ncbi:MAG: hypothetical protein QOF89_2255 [Acidobacteriota bacterium]|jgi:hypothetical protein|nr:hypothetical protein [Acidobacteriota bacterium]